MIISDKEAIRNHLYFLFAYYFHWTPEQVDKVEAYLIDSLLATLPKWIQETNKVMNNG